MIASGRAEDAATDASWTAAGGAIARLLAWAARTFGWGFAARVERRMQLLEVLPLGGKRQLMLVECDGLRYLVGAGGESVNAIAAIGPVAASPAMRLDPGRCE